LIPAKLFSQDRAGHALSAAINCLTLMSVWHYQEQHGADESLAFRDMCIYCGTRLARDQEDETKATLYEEMNYGWSDNFTTRSAAIIGICPECGWWKYAIGTRIGDAKQSNYHVKIGSLKKLDLSDVTIPIQEVRDYLTANFESRFELHPRKFEEVVGSVFADRGYSVRVTAYSGDGGIDVILDAENSTIGIQVKRYKHKIGVNQIRELTGALVIGGHTRGIFVTTSEFQSGAIATANASGVRGYPIELIDAPRFYEALMIAQLSGVRHVADLKPWGPVYEFKF
jgi:restriction system protein